LAAGHHAERRPSYLRGGKREKILVGVREEKNWTVPERGVGRS